MLRRIRRDTSNLVARVAEQRRWLLFGAVLLTMLLWVVAAALAPVASGVQQLTLMEHIGELCLLALSALLSPFHHVYELLAVVGLLIASADRFQAWRDSRTLLAAIPTSVVSHDSPLGQAAAAAGVQRDRLVRIAESPLPAFTMGAFRPRVFVNDRLEQVLSRDELIAVLAHEGEHVRRRDPLRLSVMRFVSKGLFWLPAFKALESQLTEETELRADEAASKKCGVAAASAILTLVRSFGRAPMPSLSTGFSPHEFLALRVRVLAGEGYRARAHASRAAIATTLAMLGLMWTVALAELHQSTHPHHVEAAASDCRGDNELSHGKLVCLQENESGNEVSPRAVIER